MESWVAKFVDVRYPFERQRFLISGMFRQRQDSNTGHLEWTVLTERKLTNGNPPLGQREWARNPHHAKRDSRTRQSWSKAEKRLQQFARVSILRKEEGCLAARAWIPRVLQWWVRRSRGEAIGRKGKLIGTPNRIFYSEKPPSDLGGW